MFEIKKGTFWYGGNRKLEFDLTKGAISSYLMLKKVFPKHQGFIITTQKAIIKKEAGAFNYFIKNTNSWYRLKIADFKKMFWEKQNG